jgi:alpha-galactosidase
MLFLSMTWTVERFSRSKKLGGNNAMSRGRRTLLLLCLLLMASLLSAHTLRADNSIRTDAKISYDPQTHVFRLAGADISYIFGVNERQQLQSIYWGQRLPDADSIASVHSVGGSSSFDPPINATQQEYVAWGGGLYVTPDVKVTFADGNRDLVLQYVSHQIDGNHLNILLKDVQREVYVTLSYTVDAETGILARSARIENRTNAALTVEELNAATWNLPAASDYQLYQLTGKWAGEWNLQRQSMHPGKTMMESRRGSTGDEINPWFALERGVSQGEQSDDVWFGALGWSGSWQIAIEQDYVHQTRITGGYSGFDFAYHLAPGESLHSPTFYAGFAQHGMGEASRLLHRYELHALVPQRANWRPRPVLYNSWEATGFDVDEAGQEVLAEKAARIGVERFVIDDGWTRRLECEFQKISSWA